MSRNYAALPHDYLEEMEMLSDAEFGRLCRALLRYSKDGETPTLSGNERIVFPRVKMQEDRFQASYDDLSKIRQNAGRQGGRPQKQTEANESKKKQTEANESKKKQTEANESKKKQTEANESKKTYTETETNTETNTKTKTEEEAPPIPPQAGGPSVPTSSSSSSSSSACSYFLDRLNPMASQRSLEALLTYESSLGTDVCIFAMDLALDNRTPTWPFVRTILQSWQEQGVKCLADAQAANDRHRQGRKGSASVPEKPDYSFIPGVNSF